MAEYVTWFGRRRWHVLKLEDSEDGQEMVTHEAEALTREDAHRRAKALRGETKTADLADRIEALRHKAAPAVRQEALDWQARAAGEGPESAPG